MKHICLCLPVCILRIFFLDRSWRLGKLFRAYYLYFHLIFSNYSLGPFLLDHIDDILISLAEVDFSTCGIVDAFEEGPIALSPPNFQVDEQIHRDNPSVVELI